jgi:transposase
MELYVGIDVGKNKLDIHLNNKDLQVSNSQVGFKKIIKFFKKEEQKGFSIKLVICEATGGYEQDLVALLDKENYRIHVAHPNKVRDFAKSQGILAKTDRIDARMLSDYGKKYELIANYKPLCAEQIELQGLLQRRRQLLDEKIREENRLDKSLTNLSQQSIKSHVKWLKDEINRLEEEIKGHIKKNPNLSTPIDLLKSIPGIGELSAATIITALPEIGQIEDKSLCALVGVAPMNRDSGKYRGKRQIKGGRSVVREILYMAAISSIRCNSVVKNCYRNLRSKGKPAKVAIVAAIRKLLLIVNSVFKRQTPWVENYQRGLT